MEAPGGPVRPWPPRPVRLAVDRRRHGHGPARWLSGPVVPGPLRRRPAERLAGGVAAGVAAKTGLDVTVVRIGFVVAALASGLGLAAYVIAWLVLADDGAVRSGAAAGDAAAPTIASRAVTDRRGIALGAGLGSLLFVVSLVASAFGADWLGSLTWPLVIAAAGLVLLWRNAPAEEQATLRRLAEPLLALSDSTGRRRTALRVVLGMVLLAGGLLALLLGHASSAQLRPLAGVFLVLAAVVVVLGPWWLRIGRDLVVERQARVRAEERADMAARVHDSVLQTLALIQRRAGEPQQVITLARAQERELRSWLFDGRAPGSVAAGATTVAAGVRDIQQQVEATHGITVEAVTVGDCDLDDALGALLGAAREATVNAAKWSGVGEVSLFAEVEPDRVSVFVRDRGRGFDPGSVPADRKGLAESVRARMARRGGAATVRSAPGSGTEVSLTMPRGASGVTATA